MTEKELKSRGIKIALRGEEYEENKACITATDVEALFPSLESKTSARMVKDKIAQSKMKFMNLEVEEMLLYILVNEEYLDQEDVDIFREHLPERKNRQGKGPTMRNDYIQGGNNWRLNNKKNGYPWKHKGTLKPTEKQKRLLMGMVCQIAIQVMFGNFAYTFGGKIYKQKKGGPIGARITMAVAQIVMEYIWKRFIKTWKSSNWKKIDKDYKKHAKKKKKKKEENENQSTHEERKQKRVSRAAVTTIRSQNSRCLKARVKSMTSSLAKKDKLKARLKPSSPGRVKPSSSAGVKPISPDWVKPSNPARVKPSSPVGVKQSSSVGVKPNSLVKKACKKVGDKPIEEEIEVRQIDNEQNPEQTLTQIPETEENVEDVEIFVRSIEGNVFSSEGR